MTWQNVIAKKTKSRRRGPFERMPHHTSIFEDYEEYDSNELTNIFIMILDKISDGEAGKYESDAHHNLMEMEEDGTKDQYLKGMDEREYVLRYIVNKTKIGEKNITLNRMFSKIFKDKDFKLR
jgi:hypothetical protein